MILFFAFSFTFSISHEEAVSAFEQNISALALAAQVIPGHIIHITSTVLNIFAVLTAFFGIYLGFHEAIKGIILNLLSTACTRWWFGSFFFEIDLHGALTVLAFAAIPLAVHKVAAIAIHLTD